MLDQDEKKTTSNDDIQAHYDRKFDVIRNNYDDETSHPTDKNDQSTKSASTKELQGSEAGGGKKNAAADSASREEADKVGWFNKNKDKPSGKKGRFRGFFTKRKSAATIATVTIIGGGGFGMFGMLSGPLELITLGQSLLKPAAFTETAVDVRTKGFLKWYRFSQTGDVGETRVSVLGSRRFGNVVQQLEAQGITFERNQNTGRPTRVNIDGSKLPDHLKGGNPAETRANIARHYNLDVHQVSGLDGGKFVINERGMNARQARLLASSSLAVLDGGKIQTAMNKRVIGKFWNAPSLFHPMQRSAANLQERWDTRAAKKAAEKQRKGQDSKRAKLLPKYTNTRDALAKKLGPVSGTLSSALTLTGALCVVKEASDLLPLVNYEHVVTPAMEEAIDKQAVPAQLQAGDDFDIVQPAAVSETLVDDEGRSIWESKALTALADGGEGAGEDIYAEYKQAFIFDGGSIEGLIRSFDEDRNISKAAEGAAEGADAIAEKACTPLGYIVQGVVSGVLIVAGPGGWIVKGAQVAGSVTAMAGIMHVLNQIVEARGEELWEFAGGPQGGAMLAYGARAAHNLNSTGMGGVPLSGSEEQARLQEHNERELQEFQQKSFFARIFDVYDTRSFAATAVRSAPAKNVSSVATTLTNPIKSLSGSFSSILSPRVNAQETYDWGFPIYSIPWRLIEDPKFEDPYENANRAKQLLDNNTGDYKKRAEVCFGVEFLEGPHGWEVIQERPVVTFEDEYKAADCDDLSNDDWARMLLFVFDNAIVNTIDCWEGGTESCQRMSGSAGTGIAPGTEGQSEVIDGFAFPLQTTKSGINNPNIFSNGTTNVGGHPYTAYDIYADVGVMVVSATAGKVTSVNPSSRPCGDGRTALSVQVFDNENNRTYFYQHMTPGSQKVTLNQVVQPGQQLGTLGSGGTHCNTVPHLHIDAVNGTTRPPCRRGSCSESAKAMFIDLGPSLYQTFQTLKD